MPPDSEKRQLRELKRALKKRGNKHRRQELKKTLTDNPEEAAHAEENLGRHRSDGLNGFDKDATRKKKVEDPNSPPRHEGDAEGSSGRPIST